MTTQHAQSTFDIESLPVKITYVGQTKRDDWDCDQWRVEITYKNARGSGFWTTDYFTGLGLRHKPKQAWLDARPVKPTIASVLHSLFLDASAADYNFADWCDEYGYSDDSIKALNIYKQCLDVAAHLRKAFDADTRSAIQATVEDM